MLEMDKKRAALAGGSVVTSFAFLLASVSMVITGQPFNTTIICFLSFLLIGISAFFLIRDVKKSTKTMSINVYMEDGLPVEIESRDLDASYINSINLKLSNKRLTTRDMSAHLLHRFNETIKLNNIPNDSRLEVTYIDIK